MAGEPFSYKCSAAAIKGTVVYLLFAIAWILFSDRILLIFKPDPASLTTAQTVKGLLFVGISATFLFVLLERVARRQRRDQRTLRDSEDRLSAIFRSAPVGMGLITADRVLLKVNDHFCALCGYPQEELLGINTRHLYVDEASYTAVGRAKDQGGSGGTGQFESQWRRKDGQVIDVLLSSMPLDPDGHPDQFIFSVLDISDRKRAEQALHDKSEELERYFSLSLDLLCIATTSGVFVRLNPEWADVLGYGQTELEGRNFLELVHPDDREATLEALSRLDRQETVRNFVNRYRRADGCYRWIEWRSRPYGALVYAAARDITERKLAEEELLHKDALLRAMLRNLPFDFWARDISQRIIAQSDESIRLWGDLTDQDNPDGLLDEAIAGRWRSNNERGLAGETITEECAYAARNGALRTYRQIVAPIREGEKVLGLLGINIDITEYNKALEAVRTSNELLAAFIRHSPIYAFIKEVDDIASRTLMASDNYVDMIGIPGSAMRGKTMEELFPADFAAKITADDQQVVSRGEVLHLEEELGGRDYITIKFPIVLGGRNYLAGYTIDLTERKQAEQEREKLQSQLMQAQKMELVGRLAGGVAHDFNNMLGVILGHAEMALGRIEPDHPLRTSLRDIHMAAERSADLTRQLLAFARKQTVAPRLLDLNETVQGLLGMLRRLIGEDIALIWRPGGQVGQVLIDPSQIDQILVNLCVNARDAIGGTGTVTIETRTESLDETFCANHPEAEPGKYVLLVVRDDGCGMGPEVLSHLFEPFFTTKEMGKGTGLGLATVYGIVKQNKGFILVTSAPGEGSTFALYLPSNVEPTTLGAAVNPEEAMTGNETILVVEDEPMILKMTRDMLELLGYSVLTASNPGEALRLAREHASAIHLLMTDVIMPEMNGRDLAEQIREIRPRLGCLFMSGYTADVIGPQGVLNAGVHFIQKPFVMHALAAKVRTALEAAAGNGHHRPEE